MTMLYLPGATTRVVFVSCVMAFPLTVIFALCGLDEIWIWPGAAIWRKKPAGRASIMKQKNLSIANII
jgi:hypothetical protein